MHAAPANPRASRVRWLLACALLGLACLATFRLTGELRSWDYGVTRAFVVGFVLFAPVTLFPAALVSAWILRARSSTFLGLLLVPAAISLVGTEAWFQLEEACFRAEVARSGKPSLYHPRWSPFSHSGLCYDDGEYGAHD